MGRAGETASTVVVIGSIEMTTQRNRNPELQHWDVFVSKALKNTNNKILSVQAIQHQRAASQQASIHRVQASIQRKHNFGVIIM